MQTRRTALKIDSRGDYRPYIGVRKDGKQQRFNLGRDLAEAERRRDRIQRLFAESVAALASFRHPPYWSEAALQAAKMIADGFDQVVIPPPATLNEIAPPGYDLGDYDPCWAPLNPAALVWSHAVATRLYPSVKWVLPEGGVGREAVREGQLRFEIQAQRQAKLLGAAPPTNPVAGTLHQALDRYDHYLENEASRTISFATKENRRAQVRNLKSSHEDIPLGFLDLAACQQLFDYWRHRPERKSGENGERYGARTVRHPISELTMFFDWLHSTADFAWRKPEDFDTLDKTIVRDKSKRSILELVGKPTFTVEQLSLINTHCNRLERLLLYLGLNCGFGAAESGRLEPDDIFIRKPNPLAHLWKGRTDFSVSEDDSWIAYLRPKTGVAGCWWLWPETVAALEEWQTDRPDSTTPRIIVTEKGTSLYREESRNGQSGFNNLWTRLRDRIRREEGKKGNAIDLPDLPFGTLRDQFADWAVHQGEDEASSIGLAHGKPFKDDLLVCYANLPFPRLFKVQRRYREYLKPMLDAAPAGQSNSG